LDFWNPDSKIDITLSLEAGIRTVKYMTNTKIDHVVHVEEIQKDLWESRTTLADGSKIRSLGLTRQESIDALKMRVWDNLSLRKMEAEEDGSRGR
jgi:hypothetical protein